MKYSVNKITTSLGALGLAASLSMIATAASASCTGDRHKHSCTMADGGSYELQLKGNTTYIKGVTAEGKHWSRITRKQRNTVTVTATEPNGNKYYEETVTRGQRTVTTHIPSDGPGFTLTCDGDNCVTTPGT